MGVGQRLQLALAIPYALQFCSLDFVGVKDSCLLPSRSAIYSQAHILSLPGLSCS